MAHADRNDMVESKSTTGGTNSLNDGINRYQGLVDTIVQLFRDQVSV
jgi:hypothetical protein